MVSGRATERVIKRAPAWAVKACATMPIDTHLCTAAELPEGSAKGFEALGIFVTRHAGQVHGWLDICPHHGSTPLPWRRDAYLNADASRIVCAAHGAQFEPATGLCTLGPCLGQRLTRVAVHETPAGNILLSSTPPNETPA